MKKKSCRKASVFTTDTGQNTPRKKKELEKDKNLLQNIQSIFQDIKEDVSNIKEKGSEKKLHTKMQNNLNLVSNQMEELFGKIFVALEKKQKMINDLRDLELKSYTLKNQNIKLEKNIKQIDIQNLEESKN